MNKVSFLYITYIFLLYGYLWLGENSIYPWLGRLYCHDRVHEGHRKEYEGNLSICPSLLYFYFPSLLHCYTTAHMSRRLSWKSGVNLYVQVTLYTRLLILMNTWEKWRKMKMDVEKFLSLSQEEFDECKNSNALHTFIH